mgnify:CR=1 FL=1
MEQLLGHLLATGAADRARQTRSSDTRSLFRLSFTSVAVCGTEALGVTTTMAPLRLDTPPLLVLHPPQPGQFLDRVLAGPEGASSLHRRRYEQRPFRDFLGGMNYFRNKSSEL